MYWFCCEILIMMFLFRVSLGSALWPGSRCCQPSQQILPFCTKEVTNIIERSASQLIYSPSVSVFSFICLMCFIGFPSQQQQLMFFSFLVWYQFIETGLPFLFFGMYNLTVCPLQSRTVCLEGTPGDSSSVEFGWCWLYRRQSVAQQPSAEPAQYGDSSGQ